MQNAKYVLCVISLNHNILLFFLFSINNYTPDIPRNDVRRILKSALQVWADHTPLTFREATGRGADIDILFAKGEHGDGYDFDGRGGTLAHAYFPGGGIGGDAHFDDDEFYTQNSYRGRYCQSP